MQAHEYESLAQLRGSMSLVRCPDPHHFERVQYIRSLETYQPQWDLLRSEAIQCSSTGLVKIADGGFIDLQCIDPALALGFSDGGVAEWVKVGRLLEN